MGQPVSLPTARFLAPASAVFNFAAQIYGMLSTPNMKDISDSHVAAFSPHPMAIGYFFGPQQLLQLYWLTRLWRNGAEADRAQLEYVPYYALGNVMIGLWMFAWNSSSLKLSNAFVAVNTLAQLYYVCAVMPSDTSVNGTETRATRWVAQTFAGIGILDLLHNSSVAYFRNVSPNLVTQILTPIAFAASSLISTPLMNACIAYDALGIFLGQRNYNVGGQGWTNLIGGTAVGCAAILAGKLIMGAR